MLFFGNEAKSQDTLVNSYLTSHANPLEDSNGNYIYTSIEVTATFPYGEEYEKYYDMSARKAWINILYANGFGQPLYHVDIRQTPNYKHLIRLTKIEPASTRVKTSFQPFVADWEYGNIATQIIGSAEQHQKSYYANPPAGVTANAFPFSQTKTGLNRVEQGGVGAEWQLPNPTVPNSGHTAKSKTVILTENSPEFVRWGLTATGIAPITGTSLQLDNKIIKEISYGPDWTNGNTGTTVSYFDQYGKLKLQRVYLNETTYAETAYVYDILGRLRYVIPPGTPFQSIDRGSTLLNTHLYVYEYNDVDQLIASKFPQQEWSYFVYDKLERPVLTQDALQREKGIWSFHKFDKLGREIMTGVLHSSNTQAQLQTIINGNNRLYETKSVGNTTGYTNTVFPTTGYDLYTISYYDDYESIPTACPWRTTSEYYNRNISGLSVAQQTRILGTTTFLWSSFFYDKEQRPYINYTQNELGGTNKTISNYDYAGLLLEQTAFHSTASENIRLKTRYEYDHRGRVLKEYSKVNDQSEIIQYAYIYNELGQLVEKKIHSPGINSATQEHIELATADQVVSGASKTVVASKSITLKNGFTVTNGSKFNALIDPGYLQSVSYQYDVQGALKKINELNAVSANRLFALELFRNDGDSPRFNGSISGQKWKMNVTPPSGARVPDKFSYQYDGMDRITTVRTSSGGINQGDYNENFEYDIAGNIQKLSRYAQVSGIRTRIDSLHYTYDHNRHTRIDNVAGLSGVGFSELTQTNNEYRYNSNGMLVADDNKGIAGIRYNAFGLVDSVGWTNGNSVIYTYDGNGKRIRKSSKLGSNTLVTYYAGGVEYSMANGGSKKLDLVGMNGGRLRKSTTSYNYEYDIVDHLGNVRATFDALPSNPSQARLLQYNSYYAFGNPMPGAALQFVSGEKNKYLYNGKELQEETGWFDYGARMYDAQVGRWGAIDRLSENHYGLSTYQYVMNNPLRYIDPMGLDTIDISGGRSGSVRVGDWVNSNGNFYHITQDYFDWLKNHGGSGVYGPEVVVTRTRNGNLTSTGSTAGNAFTNNSIALFEMMYASMGAASDRAWQASLARAAMREQMRLFGNSMADEKMGIANRQAATLGKANQNNFPGINMYERDWMSGGITLPPAGIWVEKYSNNLKLKQHEYGHKLQFDEMGFLKYYSTVGIPSIYNTVENYFDEQSGLNLSAPHHYYHTETDANTRSQKYFGPTAPINNWPNNSKTQEGEYNFFIRSLIYLSHGASKVKN